MRKRRTQNNPKKTEEKKHLGMFAAASTSLAIAFSADLVDSLEAHLRDQLGNQDVHTASHSSPQIGRAARDAAQRGVGHKHVTLSRDFLQAFLNRADPVVKSLCNLHHISSVLHADDAQVVAFVDPQQESLVLVVEDTAAQRPVFVVARGSLHGISSAEEEMVRDQPLSLLIGHARMQEKLALKLTLQLGKDLPYGCIITL